MRQANPVDVLIDAHAVERKSAPEHRHMGFEISRSPTVLIQKDIILFDDALLHADEVILWNVLYLGEVKHRQARNTLSTYTGNAIIITCHSPFRTYTGFYHRD